MLEKINSASIRQSDVESDKVWDLLLEFAASSPQVFSFSDLVVPGFQLLLQRPADQLLIINNQYVFSWHGYPKSLN